MRFLFIVPYEIKNGCNEENEPTDENEKTGQCFKEQSEHERKKPTQIVIPLHFGRNLILIRYNQ